MEGNEERCFFQNLLSATMASYGYMVFSVNFLLPLSCPVNELITEGFLALDAYNRNVYTTARVCSNA